MFGIYKLKVEFCIINTTLVDKNLKIF